MKAARALFLAILAAALLAGCAEPVAFDRMSYVGDWQGENMRLRISREGHVDYERRSPDGRRTTLSAPLLRFEGDDFVVGIGIFNTTFVVTRPPHEDRGEWKMTVDGVELVRRAPAGGIRA